MDLTIIVAISENNVIGNKGEIPWHISADLKRFKELTLGYPVIMGRNTYESIVNKLGNPLPKRKNIVMTTHPELIDNCHNEELYSARSPVEAVRLTQRENSFVIGGRSIYEEFLPHASRMEITRIHRSFEGDVLFPEVDWNQWQIDNQIDLDDDGLSYSFISYFNMNPTHFSIDY